MSLLRLIFLQFILIPSFSYSLDLIRFEGKQLLNPEGVFYAKSDTFQLNAKDLSELELTSKTSGVPNFGVTSEKIVMRFNYQSVVREPTFFVLNKSNLDLCRFFRLDLDSTSLIEIYSDSIFGNPNQIAFKFDELHSRQEHTYFLIISGQDQLTVPMAFRNTEQQAKSTTVYSVFLGVYSGIILVMFFYNLFVFFSVRDRSYLLYVLYLIFTGLTQITVKGFLFTFLPGFEAFSIHLINVFSVLAGISAIMFLNEFLGLKDQIKWLYRVLIGINVTFVLTLTLTFLGLITISFQLVQVASLLGAVFCLIASLLIARKGNRTARIFLNAWAILFVGVIIFVLKDFGVLPFNTITNFSLLVASAVESVLFSFALADRINILKKEKEASQAQALQVAQENERLVTEQNLILEQKVNERTEELRATNENLNEAMENLKSAQSQLVESEKMASLGQLTAGIAHEINNPINFVTSNIKPLQRDIQDVLELIEKYDEIAPGVNLEEKLGEVKDFREEIDVEYVIEEMDNLLKGIDEGAQRTAEIVRGLRNFSRLDEAELKEADINEGLLSTLTVLNSNMKKSGVELVKELGDIPQIECYPGKLNQVFMNIITNGIQALDDNPAGKGKKMLLKTSQEGQNIVIRIEDNGCGIPEDVKEKIFEPFFTTKDVGEGTGLGLSIVHSIIEAHGGKIDLASEKDVGTSFTITLPVK